MRNAAVNFTEVVAPYAYNAENVDDVNFSTEFSSPTSIQKRQARFELLHCAGTLLLEMTTRSEIVSNITDTHGWLLKFLTFAFIASATETGQIRLLSTSLFLKSSLIKFPLINFFCC